MEMRCSDYRPAYVVGPDAASGRSLQLGGSLRPTASRGPITTITISIITTIIITTVITTTIITSDARRGLSAVGAWLLFSWMHRGYSDGQALT